MLPSLITYYKLDEGEGTTVFDSANFSRVGKITNNYKSTQLWHTELELRICPPNVMYNSDYNGCSNYFVKYPPAADTGTIDYAISKVDSITLQFWIYQVDTIADSTLIQAPIINVVISGGKYTCYSGDSTITPTTSFSTNSWEYVACSAGLKYGVLLFNSEFIECPSCTSSQTAVDTIKISRYDSTIYYLRQIQAWKGVKTQQQILDSRNLYYYHYHKNLLMFSFYSEGEAPYNSATQFYNSAGTSTFTNTYELTFPSFISASEKNYDILNILVLNSGEIELPLPTHIWYFIRKEFAFRVWLKICGTMSDSIDLFSNTEVLNLKIFPDRIIGVEGLVHRESKNNFDINSSITVPDSQWALITIIKNSSDWFTFAVNNSLCDVLHFPFNTSLNQSYSYSGFIRNPSGAKLYLRDYYLYLDQFSNMEYKQFLNTRLDPSKFFKTSFVYFPFDEGSGTTVTNQDLNYINKIQWGMTTSTAASLPSTAIWAEDYDFPRLCSMDQILSPTQRCLARDRSLFFQGSNTYSISIPVINLQNEYTYEMWTYHTLPSSSRTSLICSFNGKRELYLDIDISNSKTTFKFFGAGLTGHNTAGISNLEASSSTSAAKSTWIYIIVSNSESSGISIMYSSLSTSSSSASQGASFVLPNDNSDTYITLSSDSSSLAYEGIIKELRIYNEFRGIGPGIARMNNYLSPLLESGLVHYWKLSESFGSILHDLSINGNETDILRSVSGKSIPLWVNIKEELNLSPPQSPLLEASYDYETSLGSTYSLTIPDFTRSTYTVHLWFKVSSLDIGVQTIENPDFKISISSASLSVRFSSTDSDHSNSITNDVWTFVHISMDTATNKVNEYSTNVMGTTYIQFYASGSTYTAPGSVVNSISITTTGTFTGKLKTLSLYSAYSTINPTNLSLALSYLKYKFATWEKPNLHAYFDFSWRGSEYFVNQGSTGETTVLGTNVVPISSYDSICSPAITSVSSSENCTIISFEFSADISINRDFETVTPRQEYCYLVFTESTCNTYFGRYYRCKLNGNKFEVYIGKGWHLDNGDILEFTEGNLFVSHCPFTILDSRAPKPQNPKTPKPQNPKTPNRKLIIKKIQFCFYQCLRFSNYMFMNLFFRSIAELLRRPQQKQIVVPDIGCRQICLVD